MGPKKKGKGSKLSRMSEEERIRYLQHRAAIEEEARRRKQQLIATFMKNKLKREETFTRLNLAKINQQWRQILRNIKSNELKEELKALRDSFEHIMKYKTQIIHTLLRDLDAAEDQHNRILQSHTEAVDRLLQIHKDRLSHLHIIYKQQRKGLLKASGLENQQIQLTVEEDEEYLNTLLFSIQISMEDFQKTGEERQSTKLDEIRNELQFYQEQLESEKESYMEKIWREFQTVLKNYFTETEVSRTHYLRLKEKDSDSGKIIKDCSEKIETLMEQVSCLKIQLLNLRSSQNNNISGLKQEQNNLIKHFAELRKTMKSALQHDENQLTYMSVCSNKVISELQILVAKAEQIFNIFSICRKYETEKEKVLPFGWNFLSSDEKSELELSVKQEINEPLAQEIFTYSKLDNFWLKYNNAALECAALKLHYNALKMDNQQLQATIRSYLAAVSQGNGNRSVQMPLTGTRPNTRGVQKQITLITGEETVTPKPRPVTFIEASTSIAVQHMIRSKVL